MGVDLIEEYLGIRKQMIRQAELRVANRKMAEWWLNQPGLYGLTIGGAYIARSLVHEARTYVAETEMKNIVGRAEVEGKTLPYQVFRRVNEYVEARLAKGGHIDRDVFEWELKEAWEEHSGYLPHEDMIIPDLMDNDVPVVGEDTMTYSIDISSDFGILP
jgi:hypothetical protein